MVTRIVVLLRRSGWGVDEDPPRLVIIMIMVIMMMMMTRTWLVGSNSIFLLGSQIFAQICNHTNALIGHHSDAADDNADYAADDDADDFSGETFLKPSSWSSYVGFQPSKVSAGDDDDDHFDAFDCMGKIFMVMAIQNTCWYKIDIGCYILTM